MSCKRSVGDLLRKMKRFASDTRGGRKHPKLTFNELPTELVQSVLNCMDICDYKSVRMTSKHYHDIVDDLILSKFKETLHRSTKSAPNGKQCATLQTIKQATELYVELGFESEFAGCLLSMLEREENDGFNPSIDNVKQFLHQFYETFEERMDDPCAKPSQLLHSLTLLKLLKRHSSVSMSSINSPQMHWEATVDVEETWLTKFSTRLGKDKTFDFKRLLPSLAEILISDKAGESFRVWNPGDRVTIFGIEMPRLHRFTYKTKFKSKFSMTVSGCESICKMCKKYQENEQSQDICISKLRGKPFKIILHMGLAQFGCEYTLKMKFEQPANGQLVNGEEQEEEEENWEVKATHSVASSLLEWTKLENVFVES